MSYAFPGLLRRLLRWFGPGALLALVLASGAFTARAQSPGRINYADWKLETAEEFNQPLDTAALGQRWRFFFPWGRNLLNNQEIEYYTSESLRPGPGVLNLTATQLATPIVYKGKSLGFTSGMLMSRYFSASKLRDCPTETEGYSHGLFEMRCRQPRDGAAFPAFWLYGGPPDEIDIFEASASAFSSTIHLRNHDYWRPTRTASTACSCYFYDQDPAGDLSQQFHTYGLAWLPNELIFYFDGVPIRHETRLVPHGCSMWLIANLAMWDWANVPGDTLVIDYIRVYTPRTPPAPPAGLRPGSEYPLWELAWLPFEQAPAHLDQASFQRWSATPRPSGRLELQLTDNHNPSCNSTIPLPVAGRWAPSWVQTHGTPDIQVRLPAGSDSLEWVVADAFGRPVARGTAPAGGLWRPPLAGLPPGTYALNLRQGRAATVQPLRVVGRPANSAPTEEWLRPAAAPLTD